MAPCMCKAVDCVDITTWNDRTWVYLCLGCSGIRREEFNWWWDK